LIAGSGVCAKATLAKQTSSKLEINIDVVRTVLSLSEFEVISIYARQNDLVAKTLDYCDR
jgi:hypothetical protein